MGASTHVLVMPSFYPTRERPTLGRFFRDQAEAVHGSGLRVGVISAEVRSLRTLTPAALRESHFQVEVSYEGGIPTIRLRGWNPLAQTSLGALVWGVEMNRLARRYVKEFGRPDIVHAHNALWAGVAARDVARTVRCPYVVTEHSSEFLVRDLRGFRRAAAVRAFSDAARVVCVSSALAQRVNGYVDRAPAVVPNTVDADVFVPPPGARGDDPYVFLSVGNLTPNKGHDVLLQAFARQYSGSRGVRLVIGGDGPEASLLRARAIELGIAQQVEFLGPLSRDQVRDAMWRANAFVLASFNETFGVVLIEALATGLPVISTRCGGPEDIVNPEVGILVEPGDEIGLAKAMVAVREGLGLDPQRLRTYAATRYGYNVVGGILRDLYLQLLRTS